MGKDKEKKEKKDKKSKKSKKPTVIILFNRFFNSYVIYLQFTIQKTLKTFLKANPFQI
jgi:hypothetical protein